MQPGRGPLFSWYTCLDLPGSGLLRSPSHEVTPPVVHSCNGKVTLPCGWQCCRNGLHRQQKQTRGRVQRWLENKRELGEEGAACACRQGASLFVAAMRCKLAAPTSVHAPEAFVSALPGQAVATNGVRPHCGANSDALRGVRNCCNCHSGAQRNALFVRAQGAPTLAEGRVDGVPLTNGKNALAAASAAVPAASAAAEPLTPPLATPAPTHARAAATTATPAAAPAPVPAYKVMPAQPAPDAGAAGAAPSPFAAALPLAEEEDDREPLQRARPQKAKPEYQGAPLPANEGERHAQLCNLGVLDSEPDPCFDDITKLVCRRAKRGRRRARSGSKFTRHRTRIVHTQQRGAPARTSRAWLV